MKKLSANLPLKALSVLIAIVLWFAVLGSRNVEVTKEIPVEIVTPSDLVVANEVPDKVAFRLSGPKAFLRNILNRDENPIRVDFSNAKAGLVTYRFFQDNVKLPLGVKVLSINPTAIVVKLEYVKRKDVPVKLAKTGMVTAGHKIEKLELVEPTIRLKGAKSRIQQIAQVTTLPVDLGQLKDSGEREVSVDLTSLPGIWVDGPSPRIVYEVSQSRSTFKIRNADIKVLTNRRYKIKPKRVTIYIRTSPEELRKLNRSKVFAVADLRKKAPGTYKPKLSVQLPSNIKLIKVFPQTVDITLF